MESAVKRFSEVEACVDAILDKVGKDIHLGLPLGLGKPIHLVNALFRRAKADPAINLHILTAISLEKPTGKSSLERRFMGPFAERLFAGIPDLAYLDDLRRNSLPANIRVSEFFFKAGSFLNSPSQQRNYICTNYTHAVRDLLAAGVNVVAQIVAPNPKGKGKVSLSCNPDLTLDLIPALRRMEAAGKPVAVVAEVNRNLPYLYNHAEVAEGTYDFLLDSHRLDYPLFGAPNMAITPADHMIGFFSSALLKDGGTLQVGIGSLGSAVVHSTQLRHQHNDRYRALAEIIGLQARFPVAAEIGGLDSFREGLYGCSEMMMDGFIHLYHAGVLKREVFEDADLQEMLNSGEIHPEVSLATLDALLAKEVIHSPLRVRDLRWLQQFGIFRDEVTLKGGKLVVNAWVISPQLDDPEARIQIENHCLGKRLRGGVIMHGGFFLGPRNFYQMLRDLPEAENRRICMTSVNFINQLYDHPFGNQRLKQAQRREARFINSAMMYTLSGAAVSDGLEDGRVVSGVGGQYNFVAMGHELAGARSILSLRSTRGGGENVQSNIVFNYGHCTIPRHLRDIVITEYGIADVRGRPDEAVYTALIEIADARFQDELLAQAVKAGKVSPAYRIPAASRNNTPEQLQAWLKPLRDEGLFDAFPFGCDFTAEELQIGQALKRLKAWTGSRKGLLVTMWRAWRLDEVRPEHAPLLARMGYDKPGKRKDRIECRLLQLALQG